MRDEYEDARKRLAILDSSFSLVAPHRHREITLKIIERFTTLGISGLHAQWWWESFRDQVWSAHSTDGLGVVAKSLVPEEQYWLVAEAQAAKKESRYWLFEASGSAIVAILHETHFHEYYIVDKKMSWLLCENHHNLVIACGDFTIRDDIQ